MTCGDCKFWKLLGDVGGICRRFPAVPMLHQTDADYNGDFSYYMAWEYPEMLASEWCGEWKALDA